MFQRRVKLGRYRGVPATGSERRRQREGVGDDTGISTASYDELGRLGHVLAQRETGLSSIPEPSPLQDLARGEPVGRMVRVRDGESMQASVVECHPQVVQTAIGRQIGPRGHQDG